MSGNYADISSEISAPRCRHAWRVRAGCGESLSRAISAKLLGECMQRKGQADA